MKELSQESTCSERAVYRDFESRDSWQPILQSVVNPEGVLLKVVNRYPISWGSSFLGTWKKLALRLQNPRLKQIHFHTLRHWKATMEFHKTRNILHVQQTLGHKNIQNTMIYTHLIDLETDDYDSATANSVDQARKLIEAGFEYVCTRNEQCCSGSGNR